MPSLNSPNVSGNRTNNMDRQYLDVLGALRDRIGNANVRAGQGVREVYGPQIDRLSDRIRSNANQTRSNLARLTGLSGSDPTGRVASSMNRISQQENEATGDVTMQYENLAQQLQERALGRGDQLTNLLLGGEGDYLRLEEDRARRQQELELAKRQQRMQLLGDILGVGGNIGAAAI